METEVGLHEENESVAVDRRLLEALIEWYYNIYSSWGSIKVYMNQGKTFDCMKASARKGPC